MTGPLTDTLTNAAWPDAGAIALSILIPFYKDDPRALLKRLGAQADPGVELIAFDDGRPDPALNEQVGAAIRGLTAPGALLTSRVNRGRAAARNRLARAARGRWLVFLDADMDPGPDFLVRWRLALDSTPLDAVFGGYRAGAPSRETRVHARLAALSDPVDAAARARIGASAVCSSNLAVRADVFQAVPFEESYTGWGWEDVDWALTAARRFKLGHIDNPADHAGLETVPGLIAKFARSGENLARLLQRHPDYAARPGARLALMLARLRAGWLAQIIGAGAARAPLPERVRVIGLKLFRAGAGAKALRP